MSAKLKPAAEQSLQLSPRVTVATGSFVRFGSGGPTWVSQGQEHSLPLRGTWRIEEILTRGRRVFLDVVEIQDGMAGARRVVYVKGRAYRSQVTGLLMRPYRMRRVKV